MTDFDGLAHAYVAAWNETDAIVRSERVEALFSPDARYVDPMTISAGHAGIAATIGAVQEQFPGWQFTLRPPVDAHHDQVRFAWSLGPAGAEAPVLGFDVAECDTDGRIRLVLGFLDQVPAAA
ncbi:MAG: nuclear transport factor 2 family protein [bacterium]